MCGCCPQPSLLLLLTDLFHLAVPDVSCLVTFNWHWSKLGLEGSGDGELRLGGGSIEYIFAIDEEEEEEMGVGEKQGNGEESGRTGNGAEDMVKGGRNGVDEGAGSQGSALKEGVGSQGEEGKLGTSHPHIRVQLATSYFPSVEVKIHSDSADWWVCRRLIKLGA